jgi:1,2-diacylglycerol 3-beta-glucosyltransferase
VTKRSAGGVADAAMIVASLPLVAGGAYLGLLTALSGRKPAPAPGRGVRFTIVVPAHNEELGIAATVESLLAQSYDRSDMAVLVVADNCSDTTAAVARRAGAQVTERNDLHRRGKGYALEHGFQQVLTDGWTDAVVVIDADTTVSTNMLGAFAARIHHGAVAVQADYQVANHDLNWRTRLMKIAFTAFHEVRSRGRARLGVSSGLRGNGMCFTRSTLLAVPHDAFSVVEDLEYGIRLGRSGIAVEYAPEAVVLAEMPTESKQAASQRQRWEGGRAAIRRSHGPRLLADALRTRDKILLDLAADVLVPPLGQLTAATLAATAVSAAVTGGRGRSTKILVGSLAAIAVHVARGWRLSGTGVRGLLDLARAPWLVAWKLISKRRSVSKVSTTGEPTEWVRTVRAAELARDRDGSVAGSSVAEPQSCAQR